LPAGTLEGSEEDRERERLTFNHRRRYGEETPEEIHGKIRRGEELRIWCREERLMAQAELYSTEWEMTKMFVESLVYQQSTAKREEIIKKIAEMDCTIKVSYEHHSYQEDRIRYEEIVARHNAIGHAQKIFDFLSQQTINPPTRHSQ
jgi:hypothetical protein